MPEKNMKATVFLKAQASKNHKTLNEEKVPTTKKNKAAVGNKTQAYINKKAGAVKMALTTRNKKTLVGHKTPNASKKSLFEKNKSLFIDLIKIHAYYGDTHLRNHPSQDSFVYAYRNDYSLYDLHSSILNLKRALHFIQKQDSSKFVFVGSPSLAKEKTSLLFQQLKIPFFASAEWVPGFISKKAYNTSKILVIYDIHTNHGAKNEALKAGYPIVGFFSIHADVNGIDYPINLNLENCGIWYYNLWKSYFQSKKHATRS